VKTHVRVLIIGGGVVGVSTLYHLTKKGWSDVALIERIGYHVRDYFLKQWNDFKDEPWGVLAHSTHVRGVGTFDNGVEKPRVSLTLSSQISPQRCAQITLGYRDPAPINIADCEGREDEGILCVPKAGEMLYRLKQPPAWAKP